MMYTINLPISIERVESEASEHYTFKSKCDSVSDMIMPPSDMMGESWKRYSGVVPIPEGKDMDELTAELEYALKNTLVEIKMIKIIHDRLIPLYVSIGKVTTVVTDDGKVIIDDRVINVPIVDDMKTLYIEADIYVSDYGQSFGEFKKLLKSDIK